MRLLNAHDGTLHEFPDGNIPKYAILSHTWREGEILFSDFAGRTLNDIDRPASFKAGRCCQQALKDKLDYVWIDTMCINKTNLSELDEAINSMFLWYKNSDVCYAFLDDFLVGSPSEKLQECRWFTRGWTLQELLAPTRVVFFDREWQLIGEKSTLWEPLSIVTGIPERFLHGEDFRRASIAQRMSWASRRQTARIEDIAYCLLGIFDVSLPLQYGDKQRAFVRLQEAIIKDSADHSLFAWSRNDGAAPIGILAESPADFAMCGDIVPYPAVGTSSYSMTNKGLRIELPIITAARPPHFPHPHAIIRCYSVGDLHSDLAIPLKHAGGNEYVRRSPRPLPKVSDLEIAHGRRNETTLIHLQKSVDLSSEDITRSFPHGAFVIRRFPSKRSGFQMTEFWPSDFVDTKSKIIAPKKLDGRGYDQSQPACVAFRCVRSSIPFDEPTPVVVVVCGFYKDLSNQLFPWCLVKSAFVNMDEINDFVSNIQISNSDGFTKMEDQLELLAGIDTYQFRASVWKEELVDMENLFSLDIWVEDANP
jgi:hypothetical protein